MSVNIMGFVKEKMLACFFNHTLYIIILFYYSSPSSQSNFQGIPTQAVIIFEATLNIKKNSIPVTFIWEVLKLSVLVYQYNVNFYLLNYIE